MAGTLPRPRTRFIGRRSALARIRALLDERRLVTLTGVGGAGKTRLALELVGSLPREGEQRAVWVELAALSDGGLVASTLCAALDISPAPGTLPIEALTARLGSSRAVVVLDNCERVLDGCAELAVSLLDGCPELRILATSREPLGVPEEIVWPVPTLTLPELERPDDTSVREALEAESAQLFVDRVRAVRPDFALTPTNVEAVVRLCRRLDGIPLALELAAARARVLAPGQIAERLEDGLDVLRWTGRGRPPRHHAMRATLAWSHDLLEAPERALFRRLGAFAGAVSLEACEAVCAGGGVGRTDILDLLARLVDQSLVVAGDRGGAVRYRLLEPVRRFALERLEASGEKAKLRAAHAAHFAAMAEALAPELRGPDRGAAMARLELEHDNLRAAWDHGAEARDGATLARLARSLFWFWNFGGHFHEGRRRCEGAVALARPGSPGRPELLWASGALAWMQGDHETARTRLEACVTACGEADRKDLLPEVLRELAGICWTLGDLAEASSLYAESVERLPASTAPWDRALAVVVWADVRQELGDDEAARRLREEARALFAGVGDPWGLSLTHFGLGLAAAREGDADAARAHALEALALQRTAGDRWNLGQILTLLGEVEAGEGRLDRAAEHLRQALEAFRAVGDRASLAHVLGCLAAVEEGRGRALRAVRLAGAGSAVAEGCEARYPYALHSEEDGAEALDRLRRTVGEEAFVEEWSAGRALALGEAVALALERARRAPPGAASAGLGGRTARLRVLALGAPEVYRGRRRLRPADWTYALPRHLLFYFLLHGPRTREQIGLDFWPDATAEQLRGRLRTALYHLRRAVGGTEWVRYENGRYAFDRDGDYWFDVEAFEVDVDLAERCVESDPDRAVDALQRAVDLYRGPLLDGEAPGRWADGPAERLRARYLSALLTLGTLRSAAGAHDAAIALHRQAVACDELNEKAHRALARTLAESGDRAAALRHLDELERLLERELDLEPSARTAELRATLERDPGR